MIYKDNEYKFVAVLNRKVPLPQLMNALGHMTAGLTSQCNYQDLAFLRYQDGDGSVHPNISRYPFIILSAKNGNQIRTLRYAALQQGIHFTDFVDTMLGSSAEDQLQRTRSTKEVNLDYFGVCLFGNAAKLDELTRKFSLFTVKAEEPPQPQQFSLHDPLAFGV
jgi:hypothetical protein